MFSPLWSCQQTNGSGRGEGTDAGDIYAGGIGSGGHSPATAVFSRSDSNLYGEKWQWDLGKSAFCEKLFVSFHKKFSKNLYSVKILLFVNFFHK